MKEIKAAFDAAPGKITQGVAFAIGRSIQKIERNVKREAPSNKRMTGGNLKQSVRSSMLGIASGKVEVGVDYGIFVEKGTRPHLITAKNKKVLASRSNSGFTIFGKTVNHPGTKPNPFFQRGIDKSEGDVAQYFKDVLANAI